MQMHLMPRKSTKALAKSRPSSRVRLLAITKKAKVAAEEEGILSETEHDDYTHTDDEDMGEKVAEMRRSIGLRRGDDSFADQAWTAVFGWVHSQQDCALRIQTAFRGELARRRLLELKKDLGALDTTTETEDSSDDSACGLALLTPAEYFAGQGSLSSGADVLQPRRACEQPKKEEELTADEEAAREALASQRRFLHLNELRVQASDAKDVQLVNESFV